MPKIHEWRLWCNDEAKFVRVTSYTKPTECPNNAEHTINNGKTTVINSFDNPHFHESVEFFSEEKPVTEQTNWRTLGGVITNPSFFSLTGDLSKLFSQLNFEYKAVGTGLQIRLIEQQAGKADAVLLPETDLPATADAWDISESGKYSTIAPRTGQSKFILQARLNGATSASFRFSTISLLENMI